MTLEDDARRVAADFGDAPFKDVLAVLDGIVPLLRNSLTSEYLQKKIDELRDYVEKLSGHLRKLNAACVKVQKKIDELRDESTSAAGAAGARTDLQELIDGIKSESDGLNRALDIFEQKQRSKCALRPYVDWYLQGLGAASAGR